MEVNFARFDDDGRKGIIALKLNILEGCNDDLRWKKKKRITQKRFLLVKDNVGKTEKSRLNVKWHDMTCFYWWDMNWDIREWWFKSNNLKKVTCEYIKLSYFFIIFHDDILKLYKSTCGRYTIYHIYFVDDLFLFRETLISQYNLKVS